MNKKTICRMIIWFSIIMMAFSIPNMDVNAAKKIKLSKATITLSTTTYTYNGKAKKPKVTLKYKKKKIAKKYYKVTYSNNKNAGIAKVKIKLTKKGKKKYSGSKTKTFTINPAPRTITPDQSIYSLIDGCDDFKLGYKLSKKGGEVTYTSNNTNIATVSDAGKVSIKGAGTATITINVDAITNYDKASAEIAINVAKRNSVPIDVINSITNYDYKTETDRMINAEYGTNYFGLIDAHTPFNTSYLTEHTWSVLNNYTIPGFATTVESDLLANHVTCTDTTAQGFCFAGDYLLITAYCSAGEHESCMYILNRETGAYLATLLLQHDSHAGGIAYDGENVWICCADDHQLQKISYTDIKRYAEQNRGIVNIDKLELKSLGEGYPSSLTYNKADGYLWVAKYVSLADYKKYIKNPNKTEYKPLMWPYKYDKTTDSLVPATKYVNIADKPSEAVLGAKIEDNSDKEIKGIKITDITSTVAKAIADGTYKVLGDTPEQPQDPSSTTEAPKSGDANTSETNPSQPEQPSTPGSEAENATTASSNEDKNTTTSASNEDKNTTSASNEDVNATTASSNEDKNATTTNPTNGNSDSTTTNPTEGNSNGTTTNPTEGNSNGTTTNPTEGNSDSTTTNPTEETPTPSTEDKDKLEVSYQLQKDDIIIKLDGKEISNTEDFDKAYQDLTAAKTVDITILRTIHEKTVDDKTTTEDKQIEITGKITLDPAKKEQAIPAHEIPNRVQGIAFSDDGKKLYVSRSTGRNTSVSSYISEIAVYNWNEDATILNIIEKSVALPPMAEQIQVVDGKVVQIFESASMKYFMPSASERAKHGISANPIDRLITITISL